MKSPSILVMIAALAALIASAASIQAADSSAPANPAPSPRAVAKSFKDVNVQEYEKLRKTKDVVVLDVRTPKEFAAGHVPGAINIDWNAPDFEKKAAALDPKKVYVVNCAGGVRSSKACARMSQLKFGQLYNLEGGFKAWEKAGNKPVK